jgi:UDP-hydrolysing UDP-N-acetyl-D-glucosamine 2-epimerase
MTRKIVYITGTRADYGLMRPVLNAIKNNSNLNLTLIVTGMHLMTEFGKTIKEIERDNFETYQINEVYEEDNKASMARFVGKCVNKLVDAFNHIHPDVILLLGDRGEMLAGAIAGAYLGIPVAHVHGGDVSSTIDEPVRHAITKLSHIHFAATRKSADRIIKMGEEKWRVHVVGAPGLDTILNERLIESREISKKYKLDLADPILLVIQHPVTMEYDTASSQIRETLDAIVKLKYQTILIYPNADAGGRRMIKVIKEYEKYPFIKTFKNLPHRDYLSLMKIASVMIGNSSSGIIEAPSFNLPAINIGTRQEGRERAENVMDVNYNTEEIIKGIRKALYDKKFKEKIKKCKNPYGDGKASERIMKVLSKVKIDKKLLQKRITY